LRKIAILTKIFLLARKFNKIVIFNQKNQKITIAEFSGEQSKFWSK